MNSNKINLIRLFDTTLRDGEQTPGVSLTPEEKIEIAYQLDELGVDIIEAGTPISSEGDKKAVKEITSMGINAEIIALARALKDDINVAIECDVEAIHTFIPASEVQTRHGMGMSTDQVLKKAIEAIDYIKDHGLICEFSPMDATRAEIGFLKQLCRSAEEAGADRINIPDTVGIATPEMMKNLIESICEEVRVPLSVHCHDDFGMAVANSLAGVEGGASQIHVSVNGLGERAGNAALEEIVMALHLIYGKKTSINTKQIYNTSRLVSELTGIRIQPNKAVVGENAFSHESGIHTHMIITEPMTFEPIKPELVGRRRRLIAGKLAGTHGISAELKEIGIHPDGEQLKEIVKRVKALGDKGKLVTDEDLMAITRIVMRDTVEEEKIIDLLDLAVMTGIKVIPTASIKLMLDGKEYVASETGVGPVDAAIKAVQKLTDSLINVKLREYRLEALSGGSDAVAQVIIKVEDKNGNIMSARSAREDIVMASVEAMITGINKILLKEKR